MAAPILIETPGTGSFPETFSASAPEKPDTSIGTLTFEDSGEDAEMRWAPLSAGRCPRG